MKIDKTKNVTIIGLGYVGLPLACLCAKKGYKTFGVDLDKRKVNLINKGISPIKEKELIKEVLKKKIKAFTNFDVLSKSNIIIICVPTPVDEKYYPDYTPVIKSCEEISKKLKRGQLIILESTVNPGTCEEIVKPILEKSGLKLEKDFYLAHCPERINPGDNKWTVKNIPRVLGATDKVSLDLAKNFYESILENKVRPMNSIKEAEAVKIVENSFRDINIAFVNELAQSFDKLNIDIVNVIKGASTKPFAFLPHFPGCGVGGHCIPVDPYYLIERAKLNGFSHEFLKLAREINNKMPQYTVNLVIQTLNKLGKSVKNTKIGILGIAYKPNVADTRESPVYEIIRLLKQLDAKLYIFDPYVTNESNIKNLNQLLRKVECLLILTAHNEFKNLKLRDLEKNKIKAVIDGRNCLDKSLFKNSKILYKGIGR